MTQVLMATRIAHLALQRNPLRSTLTMLGVIIGVAAVIAMLAIGQGAQAVIRAQIASLGSHSLIIQPGSTLAEWGPLWLGEPHDPACA